MAHLESSRADWIPGRGNTLDERQKELQQAMSSLDEGLKKHFAYEEKVLPPLLGELFMRALILDHREVLKEIDGAKLIATETKLEGLSREELLTKESHLHEVIEGTCQLVEEHAAREEALLEMLRRALEDERQGGS
jgi:hemerythrin